MIMTVSSPFQGHFNFDYSFVGILPTLLHLSLSGTFMNFRTALSLFDSEHLLNQMSFSLKDRARSLNRKARSFN